MSREGTSVPEALRALLRVCECLESLAIPYAIGGSVASSIHGEFRATHDGDIVVQMRLEDAEPLTVALGADGVRHVGERLSPGEFLALGRRFRNGAGAGSDRRSGPGEN